MNQNKIYYRRTVLIIVDSFSFFIGAFAFLKLYTFLFNICFLICALTLIVYLYFEKDETSIEDVLQESSTQDNPFMEYEQRIKELNNLNIESNQKISELNAVISELKLALANRRSDLYNCCLSSNTPLDFMEFFSTFMESSRAKLTKKYISTELVSTCEHLDLFISHAALFLITSNILDNIIKFTPEHGFIKINISNQDNNALIIIKNSCEKIDEHEIDLLFEVNYQGINKKNGTGLGLAQVKALVSDYGGNVWAKYNSDACFTLYLDLPRASKQATTVNEGEENNHEA